MRIALDALGGDYAPDPNIDGAIAALEANPDLEVDLVGDPYLLSPLLEKRGVTARARLRVVPAEGFIGMEEKPTEALRKKPNSSIAVCWRLMAERTVDAVVSAGNTGAVVAAGMRHAALSQGREAPRHRGRAADFARQVGADGRGGQSGGPARASVSIRGHGGDLRPQHARHRGSADRPDQYRQRGRQRDRPLPRNARLSAAQPAQGPLRRQRRRPRPVPGRGRRPHLRGFRRQRRSSR